MRKVGISVISGLILGLSLMFCRPLLAKRIYSANKLLLKTNWVLEFKEGPRLRITGAGAKSVTFGWLKTGGADWLSETDHRVSAGSLIELRTGKLRKLVEAEYLKKKKRWQRKKERYEKQERNRYDREKRQFVKEKTEFYTRLEKEYQQATAEWQTEKRSFELRAKKQFDEEKKQWAAEKAEFELEEKQRRMDELERQKERHAELVKEWEERKKDAAETMSDYKDDYNEYRGDLKKRRSDVKECAKKGTARRKCKLKYPLPKRPKKPAAFTESKPTFTPRPIAKRTFTLPLPVLERFVVLKPRKSRELFSGVPPTPAGIYSTPMPKPDRAPMYGFTGLILHLAQTGCNQESYILRKRSSIAYIKTDASQVFGFSPWEGETELTQCRIIGREYFAKERFFSVFIDNRGRPVKIAFSGARTLRLSRISHPALKYFKRELMKRNFRIRDLEEFTKRRMKYDPIHARYFLEDEGKWVFLTYQSIKTKGKRRIKKLEMDIPQYLVDPAQRDHSIRVKRVSLMDRLRKGKKIYLGLKRNYWYPAEMNQKAWRFRADYKFGMIRDNRLRNIIKVITRDEQNSRSRKEISSAGIAYEYTSLWYLLPWLEKSRVNEMRLTYFDDTRVWGRILKRTGEESLVFNDEYLKVDKRIAVDHWTLTDSKNGDILARFLVGKMDRVIYQATIGGKRFELKTVDTDTIIKNRKWKNNYFIQNDLVILKMANASTTTRNKKRNVGHTEPDNLLVPRFN